MAEQSTIEVGRATILLASTDDPFSDGRTTGYLEFYDERLRPAFPLTSHTVCDYLEAIMHEPSTPALWKAGRITGWMEARMRERSTDVQELRLIGTDNRFAGSVKEAVSESRDTRTRMNNREHESDEEAKEADEKGGATARHPGRDPYPSGGNQSREVGGS